MKKEFASIILLVLLVIVAGGYLVYRYSAKGNQEQLPINQTSPTSQPMDSQLKTFQSTTLDFTVQIPKDYTVTEKWVTADFNNSEGSIGVGRNDASGLGDLKTFLADLDEKNQSEKIFFSEELEINSYSAFRRDEERGGVKARMYYIYVDEWVYVFSTQSEELYDDLDQIAQSFRYTP